jgi:hypothetical protein
MNLDQLTGKYVELRDRRSVLKKQYEQDDASLKVIMEKIEDRLREMLTDMGANSANTAHGTVYKTYKEFANVADWDMVLNFIRDNERWDMLERRISKTAVKDIMHQTPEGTYLNPPPPGVNFSRTEVVQIRRKNT